MNELGIDRLSAFGMPPVEFVSLAAELGCDCVGIGLLSMPGDNPDGHCSWSLRDDPALRRELTAASRDCGVRIALVEGFALVPDHDVREYAGDLDLARELGADRIACVSLDQDLQRTIEGFTILAALADERGLQVSAEIGSLGPYGRMDAALELVRGVAMANFSLLFDTMHYFRLGNTIEAFAAIDRELVGYVQLCDAPWAPRFATYMEEAMYERLAPGDGELPLRAFVALIPPDVTVSLEVPMRSLAAAGVGPRERLSRCVMAARALLARGD